MGLLHLIRDKVTPKLECMASQDGGCRLAAVGSDGLDGGYRASG
jgi:hypothetical protein